MCYDSNILKGGGKIMELKYYICETCGKIIAIMNNKKVPTMCCGKQMKELIPGTTDAAVEKHVPVVTQEGNKVIVSVGEVAHPMLPEHFIEWISIQTKEGYQIKELHPGDEPKAVFAMDDTDEFVSAFAYCNLHGLWKA